MLIYCSGTSYASSQCLMKHKNRSTQLRQLISDFLSFHLSLNHFSILSAVTFSLTLLKSALLYKIREILEIFPISPVPECANAGIGKYAKIKNGKDEHHPGSGNRLNSFCHECKHLCFKSSLECGKYRHYNKRYHRRYCISHHQYEQKSND